MKVKVYVIDFEIPPHVKRWGLRVRIPVVLLAAGGVALADLPVKYTDKQVLTANDLTANFNYVQGEVTTIQTQLTPWQTYSATLHTSSSNTAVTNQTTSAVWRRVGDAVELDIQTAFTAAPVSPHMGYWVWSFPTPGGTPISWNTALGSGLGIAWVYIAAGYSVACRAFPDGGGVAANCAGGSSFLPAVSGLSSFGTGDQVELHLSLPIAGW
jgi:hypothetical protein